MTAQLIKNLQNPALYAHPVHGFQVIETHISWVILTGEYAYKIKKPMDFGFLDFTTLDKRKHYCQEELRLNQRLAPEIYLDLIAITGHDHQPSFNAADPVIEYAIKMQQFETEALLSAQLNNPLLESYLLNLTESLAHFHANTPCVEGSSVFGSPASIWEPMHQNFEQIAPLLDDSNDLKQLRALAEWTHDTYVRLQPILETRKSLGFIRECHGDVHLGNVAIYKQRPILFDCIEFNDEFRLIDTLSDLAFLLMDLEEKGLNAHANLCLTRYLELTGDYLHLDILNFYKAYRAMVRAKVGLFRLHNPSLSTHEKSTVLNEYRRYAQLALSYTAIPNPHIVLMHGLSGSGKSTVSIELVKQLKAVRIRSDIERKRLFGLNELARTDCPVNTGMYSPQAHEQTYTHLISLTKAIVKAGLSVVVDAAFLKKTERALFQDLAETQGYPFLIIACQANENTLRKRITERQTQQADASEANLAVLEAQLKTYDPLSKEENAHALHLDTEDTQQIDATIKHLQKDFLLNH